MKLKHLLNIGNRIVYLLAGINIIFVCIMFVAGYSDHLNPNSFPLLSVAGLTLPIFIFSVVAFMLFWLLIKPKYTIISIVGLLLCYSPIRSYYPININPFPSDRSLTAPCARPADPRRRGLRERTPQRARVGHVVPAPSAGVRAGPAAEVCARSLHRADSSFCLATVAASSASGESGAGCGP